MDFSDIFQRNILFWGKKRQEILYNSSILVAGIGGLGCVVSEILVRAGIGKLILVDYDVVNFSDLNRQVLFCYKDIGKSKVRAAYERLASISFQSDIIPVELKISESNIAKLSDYRFCGIADCFDNYKSRFIIENCLNDNQFMVHAGVEKDFGQITTIIPNKTQTLKEIYENIKTANDLIPIVPQTVLTIGSLMSQEIINNLFGEPKLANEMLVVELSDFLMRKIKLGNYDLKQDKPGKITTN